MKGLLITLVFLMFQLIEPYLWHRFSAKMQYRITSAKAKNRKALLTFLLIMAGINLLGKIVNENNPLSILFNSLTLSVYYVYSTKVFHLHKRVVICCLSMFNILYVVMDYVYSFVLLILGKFVQCVDSFQLMPIQIFSFLYITLWTILVLYFLGNLKLEYYHAMRENSIFSMFTILLLSDVLIFAIFSFMSNSMTEQIYNMGTLLTLASEMILAILAIKNMYANAIKTKEIQLELSCANTEIELLRKLHKRSDKARKIIHDAGNHLAVIRILLENQQYEEASQYVNDFHQEVRSSFAGNNGENIMLVLLYQKEIESKNAGIDFEYYVDIKDVALPAIDVAAIIFNMCDNALEYCLTHNLKKGANYHIYVSEHQLIFECYNTLVSSLKKDPKGNILTTKKDKAHHGLGLQILQECTQKHGGYVKITDLEYLFMIQAIFSEEYAELFET